VGGGVRQHAARGELVGAHLDGLGVALVVQRVGAEQRAQELGVGQAPAASLAGARVTPSAVRMVSPSLSATGLRLSDCSYTPLVKVSASSANCFCARCVQLVLQLGALLLEGRHLGRLDAGQLDDVVAEVA
jgi:hypothetical protein